MQVIDDLGDPEGPVALADGSWLVTEMRPTRACVTRLSATGDTRTVVRRTGRPNGLAIGADGILWVAESGPRPAVLGLTLEGEELCRFEDVGRAAMLWPNDVCVGPDGFLYVTDSGTRPEIHVPGGVLRPDYESAAYDGRIFRIDPATGVGAILDRGLRFVNGVAFGPDGMLYVSETLTGNIYRYALDSRTARRQLFGNVLEPAWGGGFRGPDGMAFSIDGRLWVAVYGQGDVTVMDGNGVVCERLLTRGRSPANVAFARAQPNRLAVADHEHGALEFHEVAAEGFL